MVSASDTVYYQKKPMDRLSYERLQSTNKMTKSTRFGGETSNATLMQGIGGYVKSGGTHISGGCYDTTSYNYKNRVYCGRLLGGTDWYRPYNWDNAGGGAHIHANTIGVGYASSSAKAQWTAYYNDRNGLRNNGPDNGPQLITKPLFVAPWTDRGKRGVFYLKKGYTARAEGSTKAKSLGAIPVGAKFTVIGRVNVGGTLWAINKDGKHLPASILSATAPTAPAPAPSPTPVPLPTQPKVVRFGTFNFPDKTKITTVSEGDRIKRAVAQINASNLDLVAVQEGVGSAPDGADADTAREPSSLMVGLDAALGSDWDIVEPSTAFNENYFLRRMGTTNVKTHSDVIIRGSLNGVALPGRHVTRITLETEAGSFDLGNTHLVSSNRPGAEVQAGLAAKALLGIDQSEKKVLFGDLNTSGPLLGLSQAGLRNARLIAAASTYKDYATYQNYSKTVPVKDLQWIIDHIWVSGAVIVNGYTVVLDLDSAGKYRLPRASDHSLVIVSLS